MSKGIHEECKTCEHKSLCYSWLEYAGLITYPGQRVMPHMCNDIKTQPEEYQKRINENIQKWKAQMQKYNNE